MKRLAEKLRHKGFRWLIARLKQEMRNPSRPITRAVLNGALRLRRGMQRRRPAKNGGLLTAVYDLDVSAITFNFAEFLIDSEVEARVRGKDGFEVVIVPPSNDENLVWSEYDAMIDASSRRWRLENILIPLAMLSQACKGIHILSARGEVRSFLTGRDVHPELYDGVNLRAIEISRFYERLDRPGLFQGFRASVQGLRYIDTRMRAGRIQKPVITITIRKSPFDPARNSNVEAWGSFARYLQGAGYHPIVIPDTDSAFGEEEALSEIDFFRECAWSLGLRMALYERAFVNFFVPNGCAALATFSTRCRYVVMNNLPTGSIVTTEAALRRDGFPVGTDHRFALPQQHLTFTSDSLENLVAEFSRFVSEYPPTRGA